MLGSNILCMIIKVGYEYNRFGTEQFTSSHFGSAL